MTSLMVTSDVESDFNTSHEVNNYTIRRDEAKNKERFSMQELLWSFEGDLATELLEPTPRVMQCSHEQL